ncbi:MAG: hypothetical protein HY701_11260 [Gemmatimonadetes bacterium]|nr:hypothetical protein [Gemmatimonadota bacterium]
MARLFRVIVPVADIARGAAFYADLVCGRARPSRRRSFPTWGLSVGSRGGRGGERSFYFQDPFGNRLCIVSRDSMFTGRA